MCIRDRCWVCLEVGPAYDPGMLAAIMREVGDVNLDVCDDVEMLDLGPDDVAIKITHTGVCHSDVSAMNGTIPQAPPAVLGHEGAGIIQEVGSNVDDLAPGDHVIVVWSPPCGACVYCTGRNQPNLCSNITFGSMARTKFSQGGQELSLIHISEPTRPY